MRRVDKIDTATRTVRVDKIGTGKGGQGVGEGCGGRDGRWGERGGRGRRGRAGGEHRPAAGRRW
eukprot:5340551-Prymnesium_polylepis.1